MKDKTFRKVVKQIINTDIRLLKRYVTNPYLYDNDDYVLYFRNNTHIKISIA